MTKDIYKTFNQYNIDITCHEQTYYISNDRKLEMSVKELREYRDKIHYIGLFYLQIYEKNDIEEKKRLFFDKYFQYFFSEELKIVSSSVIDNIAELKKIIVNDNQNSI